MNITDAITQRRTIRKYTDKQVPDELVGQLLNAGFVAPSAFDDIRPINQSTAFCPFPSPRLHI